MNNETEFANQDEEISYKDMWLELKSRLQEAIEDAKDALNAYREADAYIKEFEAASEIQGLKEALSEMNWIEKYPKKEGNGK